MPRETIVPPGGTNMETGERIPAEFRVEVGWSRELGVQIATSKKVADVPPESVSYWDGGEWPSDTWQAQWVDLDRHRINDLIRVLRRARDAAYGRDE